MPSPVSTDYVQDDDQGTTIEAVGRLKQHIDVVAKRLGVLGKGFVESTITGDFVQGHTLSMAVTPHPASSPTDKAEQDLLAFTTEHIGILSPGMAQLVRTGNGEYCSDSTSRLEIDGNCTTSYSKAGRLEVFLKRTGSALSASVIVLPSSGSAVADADITHSTNTVSSKRVSLEEVLLNGIRRLGSQGKYVKAKASSSQLDSTHVFRLSLQTNGNPIPAEIPDQLIKRFAELHVKCLDAYSAGLSAKVNTDARIENPKNSQIVSSNGNVAVDFKKLQTNTAPYLGEISITYHAESSEYVDFVATQLERLYDGIAQKTGQDTRINAGKIGFLGNSYGDMTTLTVTNEGVAGRWDPNMINDFISGHRKSFFKHFAGASEQMRQATIGTKLFENPCRSGTMTIDARGPNRMNPDTQMTVTIFGLPYNRTTSFSDYEVGCRF